MKRITGMITGIFMAAVSALAVIPCGIVAAAEPQQDLITMELPALTESGQAFLSEDLGTYVDPETLVVTEEELDGRLDEILREKEEDESDDVFAERYSGEHFRTAVHTVEELREKLREELYHSKLQGEILKQLQEMYEIESYPKELFRLFMDYARKELQREVEKNAWFGLEDWDEEMVAQSLGYATEEDFLIEEAMFYTGNCMLLDELAAYRNVTYNEQDVDNAIRELMNFYGYEDSMSIEEYTELNGGEAWRYLVEKLNVEYHRVLPELEQYAVIGEAKETDQASGMQTPADRTFRFGMPDLQFFTARTIDGQTVDQEIFADHDLTIVNVWATWCSFCLEEMPELAVYAAALPDNIRMITYCTDGVEEKELAQQILKESGLADVSAVTTLVSGTDDLVTLDDQVVFLPTTLFFNSRGEMAAEPVIGGQEDLPGVLDERVRQALDNGE